MCTSLTLITGLHYCACVQGDVVQPWESTPTARPLCKKKKNRCTCGPEEGLVFCHCLHSAHLLLALPAVRLQSPGLVPTALHLVRSSSQGLHNDSRAPAAASMPVVGSRLFCRLCSPPLHVCVCPPAPATTQAPAAEGVYTTSSSHCCCLPWSLAARVEGTASDLDSPCSSWTAIVLTKVHSC